MTDTNAGEMSFDHKIAKSASFEVEDIFWGYKIRSGRSAPFAVALGQAVCFFFGACLLTATFGILVLPTLFFDGGLGIIRLGSAALLGATSIYLLWFASRGTQVEVHVDTSMSEISEVIHNRAGRPTKVASYGFDEIGGLFIEQNDKTGLSDLILRYRNTDQVVAVAEGTDAQLVPLRDRLAKDLLGQTSSTAADAA